jgi:alkanesulfonate monooxygenase SsuD/methylene tetrahydromethanopterin reductase-like flavin-dependent oxidoreductase (luciferase family)
MLDHLSHGRMEVGVGRGVSPFELGYHKIDFSRSREIFAEAYAAIVAGLTQDSFNHSGEFYTYKDVPIALRPLQQPHPAFWYGSSNTTGAAWAGAHGMHFSTNGATDRGREMIDAFREALDKRGGPLQPKAEFSGGVAVGMSRQIVVAETDAEAHRIARPAFDHLYANLTHLARKHKDSGLTTRLHVPLAQGFEHALQEGTVIAGSPQTVLAEIERQTGVLGINYLLAYMMFGTMALSDALRSLQLFSTEVMPKLRDL